MYNTPYQNQMNMQIPVQNNLALVKGYFRKKSVLAVAIFTAILAVTELISIFFITPAANNLLNNSILNGQNGTFEDYLKILQDTMNSSSYGSAIFSFIISGLLVAAFLIIYFKSKNPMPNANPRAGFTILQVFTIIQLVLICLAVCFALFVIIIAFLMVAFGASAGSNFHYSYGGGYYSSNDPSLAIGVMIFVILIFAVVFALILMWSISAVRLVGSIKKTLDTPQVGVKGAKLFGVLNMILGILSCLGAFSSLFAMFGVNTQGVFSFPAANAFSAVSVLAFVNMLSSSVFIILLGTLSLGYDKYIKNYLQTAQPSMAPPAAFRPVSGAPVPPPAGNPYQQPVNPYAQAQRPASPYQPAPTVTPEGVKDELAEEPAENAASPAPEKTGDAQAPVENRTSCPSCGQPVREEDIFCERCGYKLK